MVQVADDFKKKVKVTFQQNTDCFIILVTELDELIATRNDFLLGNWLEAAKS